MPTWLLVSLILIGNVALMLLSEHIFNVVFLLHFPAVVMAAILYIGLRLYRKGISLSHLLQHPRSKEVELAIFGWMAEDYNTRFGQRFICSPLFHWIKFPFVFNLAFLLFLAVTSLFEAQVTSIAKFVLPYLDFVRAVFIGWQTRYQLWVSVGIPEIFVLDVFAVLASTIFVLFSTVRYVQFHLNYDAIDSTKNKRRIIQYSPLAKIAANGVRLTPWSVARTKYFWIAVLSLLFSSFLGLFVLRKIFFGDASPLFHFYKNTNNTMQAYVFAAYLFHTVFGQLFFFFFGVSAASLISLFSRQIQIFNSYYGDRN